MTWAARSWYYTQTHQNHACVYAKDDPQAAKCCELLKELFKVQTKESMTIPSAEIYERLHELQCFQSTLQDEADHDVPRSWR